MTQKAVQFCYDPIKIFKKQAPQNIFILLKSQQNIEIQNLNLKKGPSLYLCIKISEYHLLLLYILSVNK